MKLGCIGLGNMGGALTRRLMREHQLFRMVINEHGADKDTQTLVKLFERNAGVAVAPQK